VETPEPCGLLPSLANSESLEMWKLQPAGLTYAYPQVSPAGSGLGLAGRGRDTPKALARQQASRVRACFAYRLLSDSSGLQGDPPGLPSVSRLTANLRVRTTRTRRLGWLDTALRE